MTSGPRSPVVQEFEARKKAERDKASLKYGADALLPGGRPDYDVLDYAINELVGMVRYAQMIEARHQQMRDFMEGLPARSYDALKTAVALGRELEAASSGMALDAIAIRQRLKALGLGSGMSEAQANAAARANERIGG